MRVKRASRSGVFLVELIIAILFFAVASVICVQVFVQAHLVSRESLDVSAAVTLAQNCAEQFKAMDDEEKREMVEADGGAITSLFGLVDGSLQELPPEDAQTAAYTLTARYSLGQDAMYQLRVVVKGMQPDEEPLFELDVRHYAGNPAEVMPLR